MKAISNYSIKIQNAYFVIPVLLLAMLASNRAFAQSLFDPTNVYIGFEYSTGNRIFQVYSDLTSLKNPSVQQQGQTYGLVVSNRLISGKVKIGNFTSTGNNPVNSNTFEITSSINPLLVFQSRTHVIEPYMTAGLEINYIKSSGSYTPKNVTHPHSAGSGSCSGGGMSEDPDKPTSAATDKPTTTAPVAFSGDHSTARLDIGAGLRVTIEKGKRFISFFSEVKYGIAFVNNQTTQALLDTYSLNQTGFNAGVCIGIMKKPAIKTTKHHKLKYR